MYYSSTRLVESADVESRIQRSNRKVILRFSTAQRSAPALFKGQLYKDPYINFEYCSGKSTRLRGQTSQDSGPNSPIL